MNISSVFPTYLSILLLSIGCASTQRKKDFANSESFRDKPLGIVNNVPFIEQPRELCGPTALYMVIKNLKPSIELETVTDLTFTPEAKGAFKQDILSASRRLGFAPYRVTSADEIFASLASRNPVLIFHSAAFLWRDYWHYSVVTGYDLRAHHFSVHIGPYPYREMNITKLLQSWEKGGSWAYIVLPPNQLPADASFEGALENYQIFNRLNLIIPSQEIAHAIQTRWPDRYESDVIIAESLMGKNKMPQALVSLKRALSKNPKNTMLRQKVIQVSKAIAQEKDR